MRLTRDRTLLVLLLAGLVLHALVLWGSLQSPYGRTPINDAEYYWDWGGRIASGEWVGSAPFFSAPLYPYLLGLAQLMGMGMVAVLALQVLMHVATAGLIARLGTRLFDRRVGLVACALWLVSTDPAGAHARVLAGSLQTFLVALALERALAFHERPGVRRGVVLGLVTGAASLAWPALLPASFLLAAWAFWVGGGPRGAGAVLVSALAAIAPATLHNLATSGTFIPISAHAGITFWHGNNPSATGVFAPHGVSSVKAGHDEDALARTRAALGEEAGWGEVSGYFLGRGLEWWAAEPGRALLLAGKKAWLFLSGRVYGDMYMPSLERDAGLWPTLWLAPLPVAWLVLPALVGALLLGRRDPRRLAPVVLVVLLPLLICTVFWYSPRYRLPAVPAASLLAGWVLVELWTRRGRMPLAAAALALGILSGPLNRAAGVDGSERLALEVELRGAALALAEPEPSQTVSLWERVLLRQPFHPVREQLAWLLATHPEDGVRDGARALELATALDDEKGGDDPRLGGILAAALAEVGAFQQAGQVAQRAAELFGARGMRGEASRQEERAALYRSGEPLRIEPRL